MIVEKWFTTSEDTHNLRTAILPKSAVVAVHHVITLTHKLLMMASLPKNPKLQAILEKHYNDYDKYANNLKQKAREEQDVNLEKEANELLRRIELARQYNTFVDILPPIEIIRNHLFALIDSTSSIDGKTLYALLKQRPYDTRGKFFRFSNNNSNKGTEEL
ncbi:MAG: hypothetical protein QXQ68_07470 [Candidatus Nitrosocaldaceae archaeon]